MDPLHPTRLRWSDWAKGSGHAKHDEVEGRLRSRPRVLLHIEHIEELDYAPGIFTAYVQERGERRRDLTKEEVDECRAYLEALSAAWRDAAKTKPPGDQPGGSPSLRPGSTVTPRLLDGEPSGPE